MKTKQSPNPVTQTTNQAPHQPPIQQFFLVRIHQTNGRWKHTPYTLPGLPDDYAYQIIEQPTPPPRGLLNAQPLQVAQSSLGDIPMPVWIILSIVALGVIGVLALALTKK